MNRILQIFIVVLLFSACKPDEPVAKYVYESKPHYSIGYAEYYGAFFADYKNTNNVLSLTLFSDSLTINENAELTGLGQYLYIEDIFVPSSVKFLPEGEYVSSESEKPFTFIPGKQFPVDEVKVSVGAFMFYLEKNKSFSVMKHISRGSFNVKIIDNKHSISCNFVLSDSSKVEGAFTGELPHIDQSTAIIVDAPRHKIKLPL